jgi:hypothetical protein
MQKNKNHTYFKEKIKVRFFKKEELKITEKEKVYTHICMGVFYAGQMQLYTH